MKNKLLIFKILLLILIQEYLERPNTFFVLIYVLLLRRGRHGKILIEKGRRDAERFGNPRIKIEGLKISYLNI